MSSKEEKPFCNPVKNDKDNESGFNNTMNDISEMLTIPFKKLGATPNFLTTLSIVFCVLAVIELNNKSYMAVFYYFCYTVLDYLDGYYARKYNMVTKFGDYYDHARDVISNLILVYIMWDNNFVKCAFLVMAYLTLTSFGCQEKRHNESCDDDENTTLKWTKALCYDENSIKWFDRLIGTGGLFVTVMLLMTYYIFNSRKN